jgi:hypothetical protein
MHSGAVESTCARLVLPLGVISGDADGVVGTATGR